jgi:hypothetical protein
MQVTIPKITNLLASNVSEAAFSDWLAATSYAVGARVYVMYSDFTEIFSYGSCIYDQFTKGALWTYDGTDSEYDAATAIEALTQVTDSAVTGDLVLFQFEVKNFSSGTVTPYVRGTAGSARGADGVYQEIITVGSSDNLIGVTAASFVGSVTNFSAKKIGEYYSRDIYEGQVGSNQGNFPPDDDGTNWVKVSASNRWKMFDDYMSSQAENPVKISVKVKSDKCNKLAFFLSEAKTVNYILSNDSITETSVTSITPALGAHAMTFTHAASRTWVIGDKVEVYRTSDQRTFFYGTLTDWTQSTGVAEVTATIFDVGTGGAQTDWTMALVYDGESNSLYQSEVLSWSDYFFSPIRFSTSSAHSFTYDYNTSCRVIFTGDANDTIRVGHLVVGHSSFLGETKYGLRGSISDFSTKEANTFGEYALVQRAYAKELRYTIHVSTDGVDQVFQTLTQLRAIPCVWDSNNDSTSLSMAIAFGFFSDFEVMVEGKTKSECDLEIQGLT